MESNESSGTKRALQPGGEEESGAVDKVSSRNTRAVLRKLEETEAVGGASWLSDFDVMKFDSVVF